MGRKYTEIELEQKRTKVTIRLTERSMLKCTEGMVLSSMTVRNDFIERAIEFYSGYLAAQSHTAFLSDVILEAIDGSISSTERRLAKLLFKIAVEMAKLEQMLASINEMDDETLQKLHIRCVNEVKKINGIIRMEDAVKYQRGE